MKEHRVLRKPESLRWSITMARPGLFAGSHLFTAQKPESECHIIDRLIGTIAQWSEYCTLLDAVGGLCVAKNSTENLH